MSNITSILKKVKTELSSGLPFMEGREKGSIVEGYEMTIKEFDFLVDTDNQEPYVSFLVEEDKEHFFFGGSVITEKLKRIKDVLTEEELKELQTEGLKVTFIKKVSKDKKREYMDLELL